MEEIKGCPVCGMPGRSRVSGEFNYSYNKTFYRCKCDFCGYRSRRFSSEEDAIKDFNEKYEKAESQKREWLLCAYIKEKCYAIGVFPTLEAAQKMRSRVSREKYYITEDPMRFLILRIPRPESPYDTFSLVEMLR